MKARIATLPGDGIGPEVTAQAVRTLEAIARRFGHAFDYREAPIGGAAIDATGDPLPPGTLEACRASGAILLGAVGGPKWDALPVTVRPEQGLLRLRRELALYANVRPVRVHPALVRRSPLRPELLENVDLVVVRELTGGIYFGEKIEGDDRASDLCAYTAAEVERIARFACNLAMMRRRRLTSIDKANVLATSRLWRRVVERVTRDEFPALQVEHLLVDSAAMHLIQRPAQFDVIVTENMFGDILSDEASVLAGSLGMLPSASIGAGGVSLFEPIHGSAPTIAGRGIANPLGAILSAAMLLELGLGLREEAAVLEDAVVQTVRAGICTADLAAGGGEGTQRVGDAVVRVIADAATL